MTRNSKYSIETYSGAFIDTLTPSQDDIHLEDICWALARKARFGGHSTTKNPYNVAHHSIVVADLVRKLVTPKKSEQKDCELLTRSFVKWYPEQANELYMLPPADRHRAVVEAFMHDWSEAYLVDLPTPIKRIPGLGEMYNKVEAHMHATILHRFNLTVIKENSIIDQIVRWADLLALSYEASTMVRSKGEGWRALPERTIANPVPIPFTEKRSRNEFMFYWKKRIKPFVCAV